MVSVAIHFAPVFAKLAQVPKRAAAPMELVALLQPVPTRTMNAQPQLPQLVGPTAFATARAPVRFGLPGLNVLRPAALLDTSPRKELAMDRVRVIQPPQRAALRFRAQRQERHVQHREETIRVSRQPLDFGIAEQKSSPAPF